MFVLLALFSLFQPLYFQSTHTFKHIMGNVNSAEDPYGYGYSYPGYGGAYNGYNSEVRCLVDLSSNVYTYIMTLFFFKSAGEILQKIPAIQCLLHTAIRSAAAKLLQCLPTAAIISYHGFRLRFYALCCCIRQLFNANLCLQHTSVFFHVQQCTSLWTGIQQWLLSNKLFTTNLHVNNHTISWAKQ